MAANHKMTPWNNTTVETQKSLGFYEKKKKWIVIVWSQNLNYMASAVLDQP